MDDRIAWMFLFWRIPPSVAKHRLKDQRPSIAIVLITWVAASVGTFILLFGASQADSVEVGSILHSWVFLLSFICWYLAFAVSPATGMLKGPGFSYGIQIAAVLIGSIFGSVAIEVIISMPGIFFAYVVMYTLWYVDKKNFEPCVG